MNLLLFRPHELNENRRLTVTDYRYHHLKNVLKATEGQSVRVGEINGLQGTGTLCRMTEKLAELEITLDNPPPPPLPLTIILALPRPKMLKRIVRNIAEFGIKTLYLIHSEKVEKSYWQSPLLSEGQLEPYLIDGLMQSRDTVLPSIYIVNRFRPFVEDTLPEIMEGKETFVAHPYNAEPIPSKSDRERIIIIGPEGGFNDFEVNLLRKQGVKVIGMGSRIYRVENAVTLLGSLLSTPP